MDKREILNKLKMLAVNSEKKLLSYLEDEGVNFKCVGHSAIFNPPPVRDCFRVAYASENISNVINNFLGDCRGRFRHMAEYINGSRVEKFVLLSEEPGEMCYIHDGRVPMRFILSSDIRSNVYFIFLEVAWI